MNDRLQALASGRAEPKPRRLGAWIAGRARRREYLSALIVSIALSIAFAMADHFVLSVAASYLLLLSMIRRMHDLGRSGWLAPALVTAFNFLTGVLGLMFAELGQTLGVLVTVTAYIGVGLLPGELAANEYGEPPGRKLSEPAGV